MSEVISYKLNGGYFKPEILQKMEKETAKEYLKKDMYFHLKSLLLYFDEEDKIKESTFRQVTLINKNDEIASYPLLINILFANGTINIKEYTYKKFERLNKFLIEENNV